MPPQHIDVVTPMSTFGLALVALYMACVRLLRYRRKNAIEKKYSTIWKHGRLTPIQAQEILHSSVLFESPLMMRIGVQVALFKVYGIVRTFSSYPT